MGDRPERKWAHLAKPRRQLTLYERATRSLDDDQVLIFTETYEANKRLFDKIDGVAWLVRGPEKDGDLDWVWDINLPRIKEKYPGLQVLRKVYIARVRLPWNKVDYEWLCSEAEYIENADDYDIIDIFIRAIDLESDGDVLLIKPGVLQADRDRYEVIEKRYLVMWCDAPKKSLKPMVDPNHVWLSI